MSLLDIGMIGGVVLLNILIVMRKRVGQARRAPPGGASRAPVKVSVATVTGAWRNFASPLGSMQQGVMHPAPNSPAVSTTEVLSPMNDISRTLSQLRITLLGTAIAVAVAGCANFPGTSKESTASSGTAKPADNPSYQPVSDVPIPPGTKIKTDRSLILGADERWVGKMVLDVDMPTTQTYAYYADRMPSFGWEPITAMQGKTSTLTFMRGDRAATVEISSSGFKGSEVGITVSPRQAAIAPKK